MSLHRQGIRAALTGMGVNLILAVVKILAGVLGNSYALVADGIESVADILSSLVVAGGLHISARPPDDDHPYGHGKAEPLAGAVVATLLLAAAGWIAWHSILEIRNPHHAPAWFTLPVLAVVVVTKEILSRRVGAVGNALESTAVKGDAWHHRSDALTSAAAFIGIAVALIGGPGYEPADDWAALAACLVIGFNGVRLMRSAGDDLMDRAVEPARVEAIRGIAAGVDGVLAIEKTRVRRSGLGLTMDIHVTVDGDATVRRGHDIATEVKRRLLRSEHRVLDVTVHVEPHDLGTVVDGGAGAGTRGVRPPA